MCDLQNSCVTEVTTTTLRLKLHNVSELEDWCSSVVKIRGYEWIVHVHKKENDGEMTIRVSLQCNHKFAENESCGASMHTTIENCITSYFNSESLHWGSRLPTIKTKADFVRYDAMNIEIVINVGLPQERDSIKLKTVQKCDDRCVRGKFRLSVTGLEELLAARTPKFIVCGMPWRVHLMKNKEKIIIWLQPVNKNLTQEWSCLVKMNIAVVSPNKDLKQVKTSIEEKLEFPGYSRTCGSLCSRYELIKFLTEDLFTIEVEIIVRFLNGCEMKCGRVDTVADRKSSECVVCLEDMMDRQKSATKCGHVFCQTCIEHHIKYDAFCPICRAKVEIGDLLQLFFQ